jgi:hypothetical protein
MPAALLQSDHQLRVPTTVRGDGATCPAGQWTIRVDRALMIMEDDRSSQLISLTRPERSCVCRCRRREARESGQRRVPPASAAAAPRLR